VTAALASRGSTPGSSPGANGAPRAEGPRRAVPLRVRDPVLLVLVVTGGFALALGGFVGEAPNRLLSGRPVALLAAAGAPLAAGLAGLLALLFLAAFLRPGSTLHRGVAIIAGLLLLLALLALGAAARHLAARAPAAARISPGAGFWILAGVAALALVDALQRLAAGPGLRLLAAAAICAGAALLACAGNFDALSLAQEYVSRQHVFAAALLRHIELVAGSVGPALSVGLPLGLAAVRRPGLRGPLFAVLSMVQTIPSIALFGLLIAPLSALARAAPALAARGIGGIGVTPALIALFLYALLPIARNTAAGLLGVEAGVIEAGRGMGLSPRQVFWQVELPLASPVVLAGLRIVTVQTIGLAVVAALIGAGGLGRFVFEGLGAYALDLVLLGALPVIFLALTADFVLGTVAAALRRRLSP
jgi:osmoprotectant transport system permease protein